MMWMKYCSIEVFDYKNINKFDIITKPYLILFAFYFKKMFFIENYHQICNGEYR
jgi:hypothetical protein